ncbi:MAG: hypothetical protein P8I38_10085 [Arenicella sp.]|nr:hypothetical protein [Arenicella sp.]
MGSVYLPISQVIFQAEHRPTSESKLRMMFLLQLKLQEKAKANSPSINTLSNRGQLDLPSRTIKRIVFALFTCGFSILPLAHAEQIILSGNVTAITDETTVTEQQGVAQDTYSDEQPSTELESKVELEPIVGVPAEDFKAQCDGKHQGEQRIDRMRRSTHTRLCNTVQWIDGLFGDDHEFDDEQFTGMVSVGFRQDESDGFDPRIRVRIKSELPNVSSRLNAFIGRVDADSYISNTEEGGNRANNVGLRSSDEQEDEWLIGLGYKRAKEDRGGLDYSVGAKLNSGLSPYAQVAYRANFVERENHHWRTRQTVFWKKTEKFGFSSRLNYNYFIGEKDILDWTTDLKYTEEQEQWEWITSTALHHSISSRKGISSRVYARGETNIEVDIPEFGVTFTYIRPLWRDWFIMEAGVDFRWEKEFNSQESYQSQTRVAIQFEMLLGDYYKRYRTLN